jgi:4-methylaminobutanoate oxidase (formaldehyde-forming)
VGSFVYAAKLKHGTPFLGREALEAAKATPLRRRMLSFTVEPTALGGADDVSDVSVWEREGIYRNGVRVGHVTSGGIGFTVNGGRSIAIGYVSAPATEPLASTKAFKEWALGGKYQLEVAGQRVSVRVHWDALYDASAQRMRDEAVI